jgi:hypothetical protein
VRVLVLAHGDARRWEQFLGAPKQFVVVDGETVVERCCRLFVEAGCEVVLVAPDGLPWPSGVRREVLQNPHPTGTEQDKFLATRHLWATDQRTVVVWGDVYYSVEAVRSIVGHGSDAPHCWRRPGASSVTGHKWDESFALSFGAEHHQTVLDACLMVVEYVRGTTVRDHIFMTHGALQGVERFYDVNAVNEAGEQTFIDDWTDDFDSPAEWVQWVGRFYAERLRTVVVGAWRPADRWRQQAQRFVDRHYALMGLPVVWAGAPGDPFNISAARNAAVAAASQTMPEWDTVVVVDADTFVQREQVWAAAYLSQMTGHAVTAYDRHVRLSKTGTVQVLGRLLDRAGTDDVERILRRAAKKQVATTACHGVFVVPRALWEQTGGYDERFAGWGGEDRAFWLTCGALSGEKFSLRIPGVSWHLWHPRPPEESHATVQRLANRDLAIRYKTACGVDPAVGMLPELQTAGVVDLEALQAILKEPGGPWHMMG